jgi:hypothetical protein
LKKQIIYLSNFTKFLIEDSIPYIKDCLRAYPPDKFTADIGCVTIIKSGASVIAELERMGYEVVDTRDASREKILQENRSRRTLAAQPCVMIHSLLNALTDIPVFLEELTPDSVYKISGTQIFPLVLITMIVRPEIRFNLEYQTHAFGRYTAFALYSTKNVPDYAKYHSIVTRSAKMNLFIENDVKETGLQYDGQRDAVFVERLNKTINVDELFRGHILLPLEFGKVNLKRDENWAKVLQSVVGACVVKKKVARSLIETLHLGG